MNNNNSTGRGMHLAFLQLVIMIYLLGFSLAATSAVIDAFTTGQTELIDNIIDGNGVSGSVGDGSDTTMLGGARDGSIELLSGFTLAKLTLIDSLGYISMSADATSTGTGIIQWDGPDNSMALNVAGLGGVDLTESGTMDAFALTTVFADHVHEFTIGVYTNAGQWTEVTYIRPAVATAITENYEFLNFTNSALCNTTNPSPGISAINCGSSPADMSNVGAVQLFIDPHGNTPELDWVIDIFATASTTGCFGSIGDYVWNDANHNGIQDADEMGINGIEVLVTDSAGNVRTVTTFTGGPMTQPGYYLVEGLCADSYNTAVNAATVPMGMAPTLIEAGNDPLVDSNDPAGTGVVLPADDSQDISIDFGFQTPCSGNIGDYVWNDANRNGIQDADEQGINGVEVLVTDSAGNVHTVTTFTGGTMNQPGYYLVEGLCADSYNTAVNAATVPMGMAPTLIEAGNDPLVDSNDPTGTGVVLPTNDSQDISIDFGYQTPCSGSIGDYVWNDANRNGIQDADEQGINGVEVLVTDSAGNVHTVTTFTGGPMNQPGYYLVEGLCADSYNAAVNAATVPMGMAPTLLEAGNDPMVDSNNPALTSVALPADDSQDISIDFGYQAPCSGSIGDYVWNDANRNGIQDADEQGINGVEVLVTDSAGNVHTVTTFTGGPMNQPGYYLVEGLCADTYTVAVNAATVPMGMAPTLIEAGNDPMVDSNDPAGTSVVLPADDSQEAAIDFGYQTACSGSLGDYVWNDANRNGIQDADEQGINGVEVLVTDSAGNVHTVTTFTGGPMNQPGYYLVEGLCADTYTVAVNAATVPMGMAPTLIEAGNDPMVDSNNPAGTSVALPADDSQDISIDFGYQTACSGSLGDYVWNDANRNGIQDANEQGINGVEVLVTDSAGNVHTVTTFTGGPMNQPGYYLVEGLCADTYTVAVNAATVPMGMDPALIEAGNDPMVDSNDPAGTSVILSADDSQDITIDFGYQTACSGSIGDYVWNDANRDGIQDVDEMGINGVEVLVTDSAGNVYTVTTFTGGPTNQPGYYLVEGLCADTYNAAVNAATVPMGMAPTLLEAGNDAMVDSNDPAGTSVALPADNSQDISIDFGYQTPCSGSIGDYVWNDANRDGIQDVDEQGINGVEVLVTDSAGNVHTVTTFTGGPLNQPGYYLVESFCADTYNVAVNAATVPMGMEPTLLEAGNDPMVDSNDPAGTSVVLPADFNQDITIDFGYQTPCSGSIGDYVWNDANRNGIQDADEMGINGVEVLVTGSAGNVHTVTTFTGGPLNQPGYYLIEGLCADIYRVEVNTATLPVDMEPTLSEAGNDTTIDSNGSPAQVTLLTDFSNDLTIDFGFFQPPMAMCSLSVVKTASPDLIKCTCSNGKDEHDSDSYSRSYKGSYSSSYSDSDSDESATCICTGVDDADSDSDSHSDSGSYSHSRRRSRSYSYDYSDHYGDSGTHTCPANQLVTYTYEITNTGDPLLLQSVYDDKLGNLTGLLSQSSLASGESINVSVDQCLYKTTTNTVVVKGSIGSEVCSAQDTATVTVQSLPPSDNCDDYDSHDSDSGKYHYSGKNYYSSKGSDSDDGSCSPSDSDKDSDSHK